MVLIVEMLGATSTILYGLNIILDPVHEKLEMDPENPGITKVHAQLHAQQAVTIDGLLDSNAIVHAPHSCCYRMFHILTSTLSRFLKNGL